MRVLRPYQDGAVMQTHLHAAQDSSSLAARVGDAWNEWEIQWLVMASFSLQVFLLLSAPFRKRHRSRVLSGSLWVTYLMADYVATYLLGRLTLLAAVAGNGRRQELALFWAPFLLVHLGGQETITAFSMEDNTLWKRRLLDLAAQVAVAVYLVGKQWRGDRLLVAPMALMFVCGAVKYGERIWALRASAVRAPGISSIASLADPDYDEQGREWDYRNAVVCMYFERLVSISSGDMAGGSSIERVLEEATMELPATLNFFMDVSPSDVSGFTKAYDDIQRSLMEFKSSKNRDEMVYKLAEVQVSLIHDYLYTKFGTVRFQAPRSCHPTMGAALQWLGSLGLTSVALVLFAWASGRNQYNRANVVISYILLVGAVVTEISSIFIALVSSYWAGTGVAKHLHLHAREWSGKMAQYNMGDACVQETERRQAAEASGVVGMAISWMLASINKTTPEVVVSPEVMKLLLDKVLVIAADLGSHDWDYSRFRGHWALWVANRVDGGGDSAAARNALLASRIEEQDFVSSVVLWHLVTSLCLLAGDGPSELTNPCKELSNYIMYLVAKRGVMVDSDGHVVIARSLRELLEWDNNFLTELNQPEGLVSKLREGDEDYLRSGMPRNFNTYRARLVCVMLLNIPHARDRWDLIAAVWTEILCYMALNCGATFHANHLATGGEFLTQVKMLLFIIRLPFLRNAIFRHYFDIVDTL